jgi:hypothetical protein
MNLETRIEKLERKISQEASDEDAELFRRLGAGEIDFPEFFRLASAESKRKLWREILFGEEPNGE